MRFSYCIVTFNRRERLLATLARLIATTPGPRDAWDIWVVDNASADGTSDAVREAFPDVHLVRSERNLGMAARNLALQRVSSRSVLLLDDDCFPTGEGLLDALDYLERHDRVAVVSGRVVLPDGRLESPAMPCIMPGGASCVRRSVFDEVGYFPREFFRQAEEYDLSFRIWNAGYRIERFEDFIFRHEKEPGGRCDGLVHRLDMRNNLIVLERYLHAPARRIYRQDWSQRYRALARRAGRTAYSIRGQFEARLWALRESARGRRLVSAESMELIFDWERQARLVADWAAARGVREVALTDLSKNVHATYRACREAGLAVRAIFDENDAYHRLSYRGVPVTRDFATATRSAQGVVIATTSPARVDRRFEDVSKRFDGPVLRLWEGRVLSEQISETAETASV